MGQPARKLTAKDANEKLAHRRLTVLELAERLGNVAEACRRGGIDRTSFYEWKRRFQLEGLDGLKDLPPIAKSHPMTTPVEVVARIAALALLHPAYGCNRLEALLALEGRRVSAITIQKILNDKGLGTRHERWLALEHKNAAQAIELSPEQAAFLEKLNPCFKERHVESERPGQLLSADTFMVGTLKGGPVTLAYCWSHVRRGFYEIAQGGDAPIAEEALRRIAALFGIERTIRGQAPEQRRAVRLAQTTPLIDDLRAWLEAMLAKVSGGSRIARAIRYALKHWAGLTVFLDDGRVEIDSNVVERTIRPIALNRKNALFAGSDQGGVHWGVIASLIETCNLNALDPHAYLADVLTRLINRHPVRQIDQLMPWAYATQVP